LLRYLDSRRELREAEEELREEEAATRFLEERKERAMSDGFLEEEARKMGYVKPGEIPIIVPEGAENEEGAASNRPTTGDEAAEESFHPGVPP
jgi:cell division protein FtsB